MSSQTDLSSTIKWFHPNDLEDDDDDANLNKLFTLTNVSSLFQHGDFFVKVGRGYKQQIYYLIVYASSKWFKFEIIEETTSNLRNILNTFSNHIKKKNIFYLKEEPYLSREESSNTTYFNSINELISNLKTQTQTNGFININKHEIALINGMSKQELKTKLTYLIEEQDKKVKQTHLPPRKPSRMPTLKTTKRPDLLLNKLKEKDHDDEDYLDLDDDLLKQINTNDINAPKLNLTSLFDLKTYHSDIIVNKSKKLDRLALIETTKALLLNEMTNPCCESCSDLVRNSSVYLAKYLTYQDLKVVRFNFDFGLGVFTGLEMITLPQGGVIRNDLIQRAKSCTLFMSLMILLCQNCNDRIDLLVKLIDCAAILFDKLNNLYAFAYLMQSFKHTYVERLTETWKELERVNETKFNLFKSLIQKYDNLIRGDYFFLEQNALLPNIYPIAVLLTDNIKNNNSSNALSDDYFKLVQFNEIYLSVNGRTFASNAHNYAFKCELFIQNESTKLFSKQTSSSNDKECFQLNKIYNYIAQTEFQQIIMWSNDYENDSSSILSDNYINNINQLLRILSFKIQQQ